MVQSKENMSVQISRRNLLKWAGFAAGGLALPKFLKAKWLTQKAKPLPPLDSESYVPAVCKLCPALCMLLIRVVGGKPVGVSGLPGHPVNQGTLCPKGNAILQDLYHPDRLRSPMRQKGKRGSGRWDEIGWDEALNILKDKLSGLITRNRPEAFGILAAPIRDVRHEIQKRFAQVFGTPNFWEWNWSLGEPPLDAFKEMHGFREGLFYDIGNASCVVSFGWDWLAAFYSPVEAQRAYAELRRGCLEKRARIIQIEPRLSATAAKADQWISIKPDTEGILALGIARVLIQKNSYDKDFVTRYVSHFEDFKKVVLQSYSAERVSEVTSVTTNQIHELAREMSSVKPALAITYRGSLFNQMAVHSLNALVGSIGVRRGVLSSEAENYQLSLPPITGNASRRPLLAPLHQIPDAILNSSHRPIELFWMERVNPLFLSPQPERWKKALEKIPFIVSFTSFLDESSELADLALPPHASLEAWQYGFSRTLEGYGVISFAPPVIQPLYHTGDHGDFILKLAKSLGGSIARALPWESFLESLEETVVKAGAGELIKKGGWWEYPSLKEDLTSTIKTDSGKLRLPVGEIKTVGVKPQDAAYPFQLYLHVPLAFSFGEGAHLPYLQSIAGAHLAEQWETWVEIHPAAAGKIGLSDGQMVWVESHHGRLKARARYYDGMRQDTVSLPLGLGHASMGRYARGVGANPAEILEARVDSSGQLLWHETWVKVYGI